MKRLNDKAFKGIIVLIVVVALTAILTRTMKGSETLADYAKNHPEEQVTAEIIPLTEESEVGSTLEKETEAATTEENNATVASSEEITTADDLEDEEDAEALERVVYEEGFYYELIPDSVKSRMIGLSYPEDIDETKVSFADLRYCRLKYVDFNGNTAEGEMVCNKSIADDVMEIFYELYQAEYRIESIKLIDEFNADDTASMAANNTSCFCYRVVDGSANLSNHAYGRAIDLNPYYNPYIVFKTGEDDYISPPGSEIYADRSVDFPYKIDANDLAYRLFKEHGFRWGGDWNSCKDYQHFDKKN